MFNVGQKLSALQRLPTGQLQQEYEKVFGEATHSRHKAYLVRRIIWRMQANAEGGLSERARQRALEIARDADIRLRAPGRLQKPLQGSGAETRTVLRTLAVAADARLPMPGALLTRQYRGQMIRVRVLPNGFDYEGTVYRSLSAVAHAVTGAHWNGYLFFGLQKEPKS